MYKRALPILLWAFLSLSLIIVMGMSIFYVQKIQNLHKGEKINAKIAGDDRIVWENTPKGVIVKQVHPLLMNRQQGQKDKISVGDRLLRIDYNEIYRAGVMDTISWAATSDHVFVAEMEKNDGFTKEKTNLFLENSYHLTFSFNENTHYWRIMLWVLGGGLFISILILLILFPLIQTNRADNRILLGLIIAALSFFLLQMLHYLQLIIQNDRESWINIGFERVFIVLYVAFLAWYAVQYLWFETRSQAKWRLVPSFISAAFCIYGVYHLIFISENLKYFHALIENVCLLFFFLHLFVGNAFALLADNEANTENDNPIQNWINGILSLLIAGWAIMDISRSLFSGTLSSNEHLLFVFGFLQFYPIINAAALRLKFGKVSLVLGQTIQYLIFFFVCIFTYAGVSQLVALWFVGNPYQSLISITAAIVAIMIIRGIYLANEKYIRKYFILSQQEKEEKIRFFIAQIPQYSAVSKLIAEVKQKLAEYFETENVYFWWKGEFENEFEKNENEAKIAEIYTLLAKEQAIWSRNKEISDLQLPPELETYALSLPYFLMVGITVNEAHYYGLLFLGKKKKGVYNLSDLEIISQMMQQTRLTLNVLQLIEREKELMAQTYQANLTALRSQINPHFLFNALNTISALIHDSPKLAEKATEKLAFIFRYTLKMSDRDLVPLKNEMELVQTYLEMEQIRFGARLTVDIDMEKDAENVPIPAFAIQTLIENCIKHGIAKIVGKGMISIEAYLEDDFLICQVYDNGPGISPERIRKGTGLNNVIARLENIYKSANVIQFENTGDGTRVILKIPLS
jgi:signal transduction histidine kinase